MQTFKKILISTIAFILALAILSAVLIVPWANSENDYFLDGKLRKSLSGTIDCIVLGASHSLCGFIPAQMDEEMVTNSYNLSGSMMPMYGRKYLLEKELNRNPVKTVVLEIAFDALSNTQEGAYGDGDAAIMARLDSALERGEYLFRYISLNTWLDIYSRDLVSGFSYYKSLLSGSARKINYSDKGFHGKKTADLHLSAEEIKSTYNQENMVKEFRQESIDDFKEMIEICKNHSCNVVIVVTPLSDKMLWQTNDMDFFKEQLDVICKDEDVVCYDFNLLKEKGVLFNDQESFNDSVHMSEIGAKVFTGLLCKYLKEAETKNENQEDFYSTYEEAKEHSPYMSFFRGSGQNE